VSRRRAGGAGRQAGAKERRQQAAAGGSRRQPQQATGEGKGSGGQQAAAGTAPRQAHKMCCHDAPRSRQTNQPGPLLGSGSLTYELLELEELGRLHNLGVQVGRPPQVGQLVHRGGQADGVKPGVLLRQQGEGRRGSQCQWAVVLFVGCWGEAGAGCWDEVALLTLLMACGYGCKGPCGCGRDGWGQPCGMRGDGWDQPCGSGAGRRSMLAR